MYRNLSLPLIFRTSAWKVINRLIHIWQAGNINSTAVYTFLALPFMPNAVQGQILVMIENCCVFRHERNCLRAWQLTHDPVFPATRSSHSPLHVNHGNKYRFLVCLLNWRCLHCWRNQHNLRGNSGRRENLVKKRPDNNTTLFHFPCLFSDLLVFSRVFYSLFL